MKTITRRDFVSLAAKVPLAFLSMKLLQSCSDGGVAHPPEPKSTLLFSKVVVPGYNTTVEAQNCTIRVEDIVKAIDPPRDMRSAVVLRIDSANSPPGAWIAPNYLRLDNEVFVSQTVEKNGKQIAIDLLKIRCTSIVIEGDKVGQHKATLDIYRMD